MFETNIEVLQYRTYIEPISFTWHETANNQTSPFKRVKSILFMQYTVTTVATSNVSVNVE